MKIKLIDSTYDEVISKPSKKYVKPIKPNIIFRLILLIVCFPALLMTKFKIKKIDMDKLKRGEPCLYLMNHSAFIDLKIAMCTLFPKPINIIATTDAFIGKNLLMRLIGCISTRKYIVDTKLVRDMIYCVDKLRSSILMFPEACYSFDGRSTVLPESLGKCLKLLKVPVVIITTHGAFSHDPLYNGLKLRKVNVSAEMKYILSPEMIEKMTSDELNEVIRSYFSFDNFKWQQENKVRIDEAFRAEGLNRVLYKCPHCLKESMLGKNDTLECLECGVKYHLTEFGYLEGVNCETKFSHIPDWYEWQREEVKREIFSGNYSLDTKVEIMAIVDTKAVYKLGEGRLKHTARGFELFDFNGKLIYSQKPLKSYTLNADYFWYELGDIISIGDSDISYYCIPKSCGDVVTKTRLATEEIYKMVKNKNSICERN